MALDDKIQSKGDELKGTAKEKIGEATDSQDLKNEGSSDKAKGKLGQVVEGLKDDVKEVNQGFECGIGLTDFQDLKSGDIIETYEDREIPRT